MGKWTNSPASAPRCWAAEETDHPRRVPEAAPAHNIRNQIDVAYRRTDLFERWRRLMEDWESYLAGRVASHSSQPAVTAPQGQTKVLKPAYPLGPRFAGPRQELARDSAPSIGNCLLDAGSGRL